MKRVALKTTTIQASDTLRNLLSGMGTSRDKSIFTRFAPMMITREQLEYAFKGDWIARKVIEIPAFDATREWRNWQADAADITSIEDTEEGFNLQRKVMTGLTKARLYGGAALVMGVARGKPEDELLPDQVKRGELKFVHCVSRYELTAGPIIQDIQSPYYGEPEYYERNTTGNLLRLHPSRVVRFVGLEQPDASRGDGWGDPVLQVVHDAITSAGMVTQGIATMVQEAKVDVIKIPGLTENISTQEYENKLRDRFALASDAKSIWSMLLLDKEEEWERIQTAFAALPDILQMYLLIASGAADIPVTRMLGQSPAGMNATGESDIRNYYDRVKTEQKTGLSPVMNRLDQVLVRSALGSYPDELFYEWNSLWQMTEQQKADLENKKATTFKIDVDTGLLPDEVLREARVNQLIEDGTYPGLESIIEEFGIEPDDEDDDGSQTTPPQLPPRKEAMKANKGMRKVKEAQGRKPLTRAQWSGGFGGGVRIG